ncbi:hypothetical protein MJ1_0720 [Nanobdella aerobiophila]|uniref:Uncharacterized protein n=1 Tax=Nanobdella aerobiophila TaxID=2586965 RepID=A0A915SAM0_9ARCH|nr:hypothetical protein [Nanobdella aerobiophila]BBL45862.1 hypothetical protein MJ1_0720 [Nanobdella aerobiophila]
MIKNNIKKEIENNIEKYKKDIEKLYKGNIIIKGGIENLPDRAQILKKLIKNGSKNGPNTIYEAIEKKKEKIIEVVKILKEIKKEKDDIKPDYKPYYIKYFKENIEPIITDILSSIDEYNKIMSNNITVFQKTGILDHVYKDSNLKIKGEKINNQNIYKIPQFFQKQLEDIIKLRNELIQIFNEIKSTRGYI